MLKLNRNSIITPQMFPKNADSPTSSVTLGISNNEEVKLNFIPKELKTDSNHHKKFYDPFKIPPDWNLAINHAKSRKATRELFDNEKVDKNLPDKICPCCGYEVDRKKINLCESSSHLNFLGAGYPLIFNYYFFCFLILMVLFLIFGIFSLKSNIEGHFCIEATVHHTASNNTTHERILEEKYTSTESTTLKSEIDGSNLTNESHESTSEETKKGIKSCTKDWITKLSLANKYDNDYLREIQNYLGLAAAIVIIFILMIFRRQQRKINSIVDEQTNTPADYTIIVSNIPIVKNVNYYDELKKLFEDKPYNKTVSKINFVYNCSEIEMIEKKLKIIVRDKKKELLKNQFNYKSKIITDLENKFEKYEEELETLRVKMKKTYYNFVGIAFISFETEDEKQLIIESQAVKTYERFQNYFSKRKVIKKEGDNRLFYRNNLLYIDEAPEPNDVNWEFITISTSEKIKRRIIMNLAFILVLVICFIVIWVITYFQSKNLEHYYELKEEGVEGASETFESLENISILISIIIVCFNKFCLGRIVHIIVDQEKHSNYTKLNISFGTKLSIALFFNTALITMAVEMITFANYYGGMIYAEHWVFIMNAIVPPFVWLVDPWTIKKVLQRILIRRKVRATKNKIPVTQKEANELMEDVEYNMAKRYAEIMKTMWFTFFYAPALPIGILWSGVGILIYYWVDKYNILRRRTIKENISMNLTIAMIENLELSLIFFGFSSILIEHQLFEKISISNYVLLGIGILHSILPMDAINQYFFPLKSANETSTYTESNLEFDTDYDRENPVTKENAIEKLQSMRTAQSQIFKGLTLDIESKT